MCEWWVHPNRIKENNRSWNTCRHIYLYELPVHSISWRPNVCNQFNANTRSTNPLHSDTTASHSYDAAFWSSSATTLENRWDRNSRICRRGRAFKRQGMNKCCNKRKINGYRMFKKKHINDNTPVKLFEDYTYHYILHFILANHQLTSGWICCAPCIWLRTSATVHKIAITTATLLVTSLLVASPVLFLLSTAPSQLPRECRSRHDLDCIPTKPTAPECSLPECQSTALSLLARLNWKLDPCKEFRNFSCSSPEGSLKIVRSAQEDVDMQMHRELFRWIH